jgi:hypothetical protein
VNGEVVEMKRFGLVVVCILAACGSGSSDGGTITFCEDYGEVCGFSDPEYHESHEDCVAAYVVYDEEEQDCVAEHLEMADSTGDNSTHCPRATSEDPCNY